MSNETTIHKTPKRTYLTNPNPERITVNMRKRKQLERFWKKCTCIYIDFCLMYLMGDGLFRIEKKIETYFAIRFYLSFFFHTTIFNSTYN